MPLPPQTDNTTPRHAETEDSYANSLFHCGYGHALSNPPIFYTGKGQEYLSENSVTIGDVGWIVNGGFKRLFNSMRKEADPINQNGYGIPRDFKILGVYNWLYESQENVIEPGLICSVCGEHRSEAYV